MALIPIHFEYLTGLRQPFLVSARLTGSWNAQGYLSEQWSFATMQPFTAEDGCPAFRATVQLDDSQVGQTFLWGVSVGTPERPDVWGIASEINDATSSERNRTFRLGAGDQTERYYFTHLRRLGANKLVLNGQTAIRFAVWAPNARSVELVRGTVDGELSEGRPGVFFDTTLRGGYIGNDGSGISATIPMRRGDDGIWSTDVADAPELANFAAFDHTPYMFRITKDDGSVAYRTDLYSRCQIGSGGTDPATSNTSWSGLCRDLDGSKSCSVVVDPERVTEDFDESDSQGRTIWPETRWLREDDFWLNEFDTNRPVPSRIEDLVIYELHVGGLGFGRPGAGNLQDALDLMPYLRDLGVNCVQLMPMSEFEGGANWGYTTSHYMAVEYAGGGRDQFKYFVRECHRNGMAVILDVVYNHYTFDSERAEWAYDSNAPENNIYYWYEGRASDYPNANPPGSGGYLDNGSSGWAPRYWSEMVRRMFTSSAAALASEFHFDGFRVDLTQAIHRDNVRHADGRSVGSANLFGQKLLREWSNTIRLIRPNAFLIAEDHTGWRAVFQPTDQGGLGFDATWYADYYHHLIGDAQNDPSRAQLIRLAGLGGNEPLRMRWYADTLAASSDNRVVYHESHDEAGNAEGSARTIVVAVNGAPLIGDTRHYAEARVHFAAGMTLLAPATPMFFMGEEVGASLPYRFVDFLGAREDYAALRAGYAASLFRFFADIIRLRLAHPALRSRACDILHAHDGNRVIAVRRWWAGEEMIVVGCLNNWAFRGGYRIQDSRIADASWREVFNSDAAEYGGSGLLNGGQITSGGGSIAIDIPANSVLVLQRQ